MALKIMTPPVKMVDPVPDWKANTVMLTKVVKPGFVQPPVAEEATSHGSVQLIAKPFAVWSAKTHLSVVESELEANISELLDLDRRIEEMEIASITKRRDELRKMIVAEFGKDTVGQDPDTPIIFKTTAGTVTLTAFSKEFKLQDKESLANKLGMDTFVALSKINITDLKKVLSENELAFYGSTSYGSRSLKTDLFKG